MNKIQLTYSDIIDIIDEHLESETNFNNLLFVVNYDLATFISNYLAEDYGIKDALIEEGSDLDKNYQQYYCSLWFDRNEDDVKYYCESAFGRTGYKECDNFEEPMDYFIFTDMDSYVVKRKLLGDASCTWNYCEFVDMDDDECDCEEFSCDECKKEQLFDLVANTLESLDETDCPHCKFELLMEMLQVFQDMGIRVVKNEDEILN